MAQRTLSSFFSKPEVAKANTESRAEVKGELHDSKENVEPQENLVPKAQPKAINPFFNKPKANGVSKASSKESCPSPTREAGAMEANAEPKEQAPKRPLESADVTEAKRPKTKEEADREDLRDSPPMNEDAVMCVSLSHVARNPFCIEATRKMPSRINIVFGQMHL